jgi:hypothetical protein
MAEDEVLRLDFCYPTRNFGFKILGYDVMDLRKTLKFLRKAVYEDESNWHFESAEQIET